VGRRQALACSLLTGIIEFFLEIGKHLQQYVILAMKIMSVEPMKIMRIEVINNDSKKLVDSLLQAMAKSNCLRIAVAFVSTGGISLLEKGLQDCMKRNCYIEFILGIDLYVTDSKALQNLYQLSEANQNVKLFCYRGSNSEGNSEAIYHPKLYIADQTSVVTTIIGSSNLTEGGLKSNVEFNVLIESESDSDIVSNIQKLYFKIKFSDRCFKPDDDFIRLYSEIYSAKEDQKKIIKKEENFRKLSLKIAEKMSSLPHPSRTSKDLFGWQRLVFEKLPHGEFKTSDLYKFEEEFRKNYPKNRHIKDKIRQVLQQLEDLGLIKHLEEGTWIREETEEDKH
jgi:HKD family nuclease